MAGTQATKSILLFGHTISLSECDTTAETNTIPTSETPNNPSNSIGFSITTDHKKTSPKKRGPSLDLIIAIVDDHEFRLGSKKHRTARIPVVANNEQSAIIEFEAPPAAIAMNEALEVREQSLRGFIRTTMGGSDLKLILERELTATDLSDHHGHLGIPKKQIKNEFLTEEEELRIKNKQSLDVTAIGPDFKAWNLKLGRWNYKDQTKYKYTVKYQWKNFKNAHPSTFRVSAFINVYSFRIHQKLGLAFLRV